MNNPTLIPNKLITERSPYLLQHAYNPVHWYPWGDEALSLAREQQKPILVSIGYSACHWCHVMERECFEKPEVAAIMNQFFINIKVDREERPDVDHLYMDAVQMMSIRGGWPLNVFLMPDTKPFYGGTYFPQDHWMNVLSQIADAFENHRPDLQKSADGFAESLGGSEVQKYQLSISDDEFSLTDLEEGFKKLSQNFDRKLGGMNKAPKFPMPSIYHFLLRYHSITESQEAIQQVKLTLDQMAMGGIYDQIGGGFSRYSVDAEWFAPHFEKMLYDNGQLLSLYSEAYVVTKNPLYKKVVYQTIQWLQREMSSPEGGLYSALDADSEGEEGKFYVWKKEELHGLIPEAELIWFCDYYQISSEGNWEHGNNILCRTLSDLAFANKHNLSVEQFSEMVNRWEKLVLTARESRIRPGLDDKILASWNGIALKGIADAYKYFNEPDFLVLGKQIADFIHQKMMVDSSIFHTYKEGHAAIDGYLEDYAFVADGFISLYQVCFEEKYLNCAQGLMEYAVEHFYDEEENMFYFSSELGTQLLARKKEIFDNVIPASNSAMCKNLYVLAIIFDRNDWMEISIKMLGRMRQLIGVDLAYLSNWASQYCSMVMPTTEVAIVGADYLKIRSQLNQKFYPNKILMGHNSISELPLLYGKDIVEGKTEIHICSNHTCQLPVVSVEDAFLSLDKLRA